VQIQLAQCWFHGLAISSAKIKIHFFQIKQAYMEAILSSSSRKLVRFETAKMLIAVFKKIIVLFIIIFGTHLLPANHLGCYLSEERGNACSLAEQRKLWPDERKTVLAFVQKNETREQKIPTSLGGGR